MRAPSSLALAASLSLFAVAGWRAVGPSVLSLAALSALALSHTGPFSADDVLRSGMRWPWLTVALVALYLAAVEARLRLTPVAARA